jgi:hypothetical protein
VSVDAGQLPLLMVHTKIFWPVPNPFTEVVGEFALVKVPVPETSVHIPLPVAGTFAERLIGFTQVIWSAPALEAVGKGLRVIFNVSVDAGQVP